MDLNRVVEIKWEVDGKGGYGSGYLVAPGVVLTARHVFQENDKTLSELGLPCRVRATGARGAPRPKWDGAELRWFHPALDVAVLHTDTRDRSHRLPRFARPVQGTAEIKCRAVGFPKATSTKGGDDTYQLDGLIRSGSLHGSGDLFVDVASAPPKNPESWPGISGAVLFADDYLVGVVRSYTGEFGSGVLKATPLSALASDPEFCTALGTPYPLVMDEVGDTGSSGVHARPPRPVRYRIPRLPNGYQERPEVLASVRGRVLGQNPASAVVGQQMLDAGIYGMGGIGKTVLATAVVRDPVIEAAFPDGICWLSFGREADPVLRQTELGRALSGKALSFRDWKEGGAELSRITQNERLLIVLDDVWRLDQVDAFGHLGEHCRLLVTTRDRRVLERLGGVGHQLELLSPEAAVEFLRHAGGTSAPELADVAKECGFLPLALASVGALVANGDYTWAEVLVALCQAYIGDLEAVLPGYEHQGILAALAVSVTALSEEEREAFLDCGIFPEDVAISEAVLSRLWAQRLKACPKPHPVANRLVQLTLLQRESTSKEDKGAADGRRYRLHDLYHDYLVHAAKPLQPRHEALLDAYRRDCRTGWASFPEDDGYFLDWLPYHLAEGGRREELRALMFDLDWQRRKIVARGVSSLLADMQLCREDAEVGRLGRALRMSAHVLVNHGACQLEAQLLGRLRREDGKGIAKLLERAWQAIPPSALVPRGGGHLRPPGPLVATFESHRGPVSGALQLPDGRVLSWGSDGTLRLWDLNSGTSRALEGHRGWVSGALLLPDGRVPSWGSDGTLRLWDLASGESRVLEGHEGEVSGALLLPDGRVLSWSGDGTLRLWDLTTGESRVFEGHEGEVNGALLLDDGHALSWSGDGTRLWDLTTGESRVFEGHQGRVNGALLLDDGHALSWGTDGTLRLWDLASGTSRALEGHQGRVNGALLLDDGHALSWGTDGTLRLWDLASGTSRALEGHQGEVNGALLLDDGRALSWSEGGTLRLWDLNSGTSRALEGHQDWLNGALLLPDGRALSWSDDGTLRLWDLNSGTSRALEGHQSWVHDALLLPDGRALSWSDDGTLRLWDLTIAESRVFEGHQRWVHGALQLPDGCALSWGADSTLRLWDLASGTSRALEGHRDWVNSALLLDDGHALSWSGDGTLRLWDLTTGESRVFEGHQGRVNGALLLDDGRALSWGTDSTLRLWDLASGTSRALEGHRGWVRGALQLPDGCALSWGADSTLRLWDLTTGESRALEGHQRWVNGALLLDDGHALSWSGDGTLRLWDLTTGESRAFEGHRGEIAGVLLLPDGRLLSSEIDRTLRLWDLASGTSRALEGHQGEVNGALLLDDGRALSWGTEGMLRLWDLASGTSRALEGHRSSVRGALLLDDGRALSWGSDGTLRLWDLATGQEIGRGLCDSGITLCRLTQNQRELIIGTEIGQILVYELPSRGRLQHQSPSREPAADASPLALRTSETTLSSPLTTS